MKRRSMNWRRLSCGAGAALLLAAPAAHAQDGTEETFKASGTASVVLGGQRTSATSVFPVEGEPDHAALVSRKGQLTFKLAKAATLSLVADVQYEQRPYSEDRGRVNQLFASVDLSDAWRLRLGKQRTLWGHGFSYIPTDFINPPLDPSGLDPAKIGVTALSLDYVTDRGALTLLARRERERVDSGGVKFATSAISGLDLDLIYYHAPSIGNAAGLSFAADAQQLVSPGLSGVVLFGALAMHTRSRYPAPLANAALDVPAVGALGAPGRYRSWLAGASYQVTGDLSVTGEYYRIGDAYGSANYASVLRARGDAAATPWLGYLAYGRNQDRYLSLSMNQAAVTSGSNRITDTLGAQFGLLYSPNDHSRLWSAGLTSNYWGGAELSARLVVPAGRQATEFGTTPYRWFLQTGIKIGF
jgi:hypothetical protein